MTEKNNYQLPVRLTHMNVGRNDRCGELNLKVNPVRVRGTRIPILEYLKFCENICRLRVCPCDDIELHCTYQVLYIGLGSFEDIRMWEEFSCVNIRSTSSGSSPLGRILFQISLDVNLPGCRIFLALGQFLRES